MKQLPNATNEAKRLQTLQTYHLADTSAAASFTNLVQLASHLAHTRLAWISFIEAEQVWYKAQWGGSWPATPRPSALCPHILAEPAALVIGDASQDKRTKKSSLVTNEPKVRFYAAVPLCAENGAILGCLAVADPQPRPEGLPAEQLTALTLLATQVLALLTLQQEEVDVIERANRQLEESQARLARLTNNLPGILYRCKNDPDWTMQAMGGQCLPITGYPAEDFLSGKVHFGAMIHPDDQEAIWSFVQEKLAAKERYQATYRLIDRAGQVKLMQEWGQGVYDEKGELLALEGFFTDITEQEKAAAAVQESEKRYRTLVDQSPVAVIEWDENFCVLEWNNAAERIFGYPREKALGQHAKFIIPEAVWPHVDDIWEHLKTNTGGSYSTNENIRADGKVVVCEWYNAPIFDEQGQFKSVASLVQDVSERIAAETALRNNEKRYRTLVDQSPLGVIEWDENFCIIEWNNAAEKIFGYTREEAFGRPASFLVAEDDQIHVAQVGQELKQQSGGNFSTNHNITADGRVITCEWYNTPILGEDGQVRAIASLVQDVTERLKAEEALRESEAQSRAIVNAMPDIMFRIASDGTYIDVQYPRHARPEVAPELLKGKKLAEVMPSETAARMMEAIQKTLETQQGVSFDYQFQAGPDKTVRDYEARLTPRGDNEILALARDVTRRKETEKQLQYQAQLLQQVSEAIIAVDMEYKVVSWNKRCEELYGYSAKEVLGKPLKEFVETTYVGYESGEGTKQLLEAGSFKGRAVQRVKNGRELITDTSGGLVRDEDDQIIGVVTINRDITEMVKAEQESERLTRIIENTTDLIAMARPDGTLEFMNFAGRLLLGVPLKEDITNYNLVEFTLDSVKKEILETALPLAQEVGIWQGETAVKTTDGREVSVSQNIMGHKATNGEFLYYSTIMRDISAQKAAEQELRHRQLFSQRQGEMFLRLATSNTIIEKGLKAAFEEITSSAAILLNTARVSIWHYSTDPTQIELEDLFELHTKTHSEGVVLPSTAYPSYFKALESGRLIAAHDVITDPATQELLEGYLKPLGITSMLDAFVRRGDKISGVICFEHIGPARQWTLEEQSVAETFATLVALIIEADDRQNLEKQIRNSLNQRSRQVEITTQIAQEIASLTDLNELYKEVVKLVKEEFGFYHVQLLQYNPTRDVIMLVMGYGEVGQKMLEAGHSLAMGVGLIGQSAATGRAILRPDVTKDPYWRANPLLPDTKSELAVPIKFGNKILGVLDIQSDQAGQLTEEDSLVLEGLCGQIATAIESTRLRQDMTERLQELNNLQRLMSREGWTSFQTTRKANTAGYLFDKMSVKPLEGNGPGRGSKPITEENLPLISQSIRIRGEMIGTIGVQDNPDQPLSLEDKELLEAISNQVAEALENARLLDQTQKRAVELETVARVSTASSTILEVDHLLKSVVDLTKASFGLYHAHIYIFDPEDNQLHLRAGAGEIGELLVAESWKINLSDTHSIVARTARAREGLIIPDVAVEPNYLPNPLLPKTRSELAVPMFVGDSLLGVLDLQADTTNFFIAEDVRIYSTLAQQVAVALQNADRYQEQIQTAEKLREVDRLKSEFLASMSHELRTPLNAIIGFADVLLEGLDGELSDLMREDVMLIREGGQHLRRLIGDILDMSKIEAGMMELHYGEFELERLAIEAMATSQGLVGSKPVQLQSHVDPDVGAISADRTRIMQVLLNLLSNAIKFTDEGFVIMNIKRLKEAEGDLLQISVQDSGIGIKPEDIPQVFEQFRQIGGIEHRKAGGTGLGMPISKQLVEMHGGKIWLESTYGHGTTFYFTIPYTRPEHEGSGKAKGYYN